MFRSADIQPAHMARLASSTRAALGRIFAPRAAHSLSSLPAAALHTSISREWSRSRSPIPLVEYSRLRVSWYTLKVSTYAPDLMFFSKLDATPDISAQPRGTVLDRVLPRACMIIALMHTFESTTNAAPAGMWAALCGAPTPPRSAPPARAAEAEAASPAILSANPSGMRGSVRNASMYRGTASSYRPSLSSRMARSISLPVAMAIRVLSSCGAPPGAKSVLPMRALELASLRCTSAPLSAALAYADSAPACLPPPASMSPICTHFPAGMPPSSSACR